jgi:hypothetical protein
MFRSMIMQQIACLQLVTLTSSVWGMANKATARCEKACMALDDPDDPGNLMKHDSDNPGLTLNPGHKLIPTAVRSTTHDPARNTGHAELSNNSNHTTA